MRIRILSIYTLLAIAVILSLSPYSPVQAATATSQLQVTLTLQAECKLTSATDLAFGTSGVILSSISATSAINVQCTNTTPYNIGLSVGAGVGATVTARKMTSGSNTVIYELYRDAAHTQVWGDTVSTNTVAGTGNGAAQSYTVYGRISAQTMPAAGNYADTVQITVTY